VIREDRDVDRLQWLIARPTNMVMRDANLAKRMGAGPRNASGFAAVSRILERMGDHAVRIARNASVLADEPVDPEIAERLRAAGAFSLGVLDRVVASFFSREIPLANRTIEEVREAEALCEALHTAVLYFPARGRAGLRRGVDPPGRGVLERHRRDRDQPRGRGWGGRGRLTRGRDPPGTLPGPLRMYRFPAGRI
jgi:phosphate uptake regulator